MRCISYYTTLYKCLVEHVFLAKTGARARSSVSSSNYSTALELGQNAHTDTLTRTHTHLFMAFWLSSKHELVPLTRRVFFLTRN